MMAETLRILGPIVAAHAVVLGAVIFLIKRLLLNDTLRAVDRINQVEAEVRKKEEAIREQIEEHEKEFAKRKTEAEEDLQRRRAESEKDVNRVREQVVGDAKKEAARILEDAKKSEEKLRHQIAQDMEEKAVEYGGQVFKLVFSERMNSQLNTQFIEELLDALEEVDATNMTVDGAEAEFVSSHALTPDVKARIEKVLAEKFGVKVHVEEKLREDLLAGLILKLGSLEIDGSLINRYREAAEEVRKNIKL